MGYCSTVNAAKCALAVMKKRKQELLSHFRSGSFSAPTASDFWRISFLLTSQYCDVSHLYCQLISNE